MRKSLALFASAALMSLTLAAHADTYTYDFSSTYSTGVFSFSSATLIKTTTNIFTASGITNLTCSLAGSACTSMTFTLGPPYQIALATPTSSELDGSLGASFFNVGGNSSRNHYLIITDVATPVAATPEPSSLVLLGTGILGFAGAARRRFLKT